MTKRILYPFFLGAALALPSYAKESRKIGGLECAERTVLLAAKKNVAENYNNSPTSGGYCAMGVRTSLQLSRVGDVRAGLGNAIDYLRTLRPHGFVDSGLRDPRSAPPGSILIFSGPLSNEYLRTGRFGRPAGTWLGHVTIKGDDSRYYTDGRTREAAVGWSGDRNEQRIRNLVGIYVPDNELASRYQGKCGRISEKEAFFSLVLAANDAHSLDFFDVAAEAEGRALAREGLAQIERLGRAGTRAEDFREVLRLALEAGPFDDEAQLTQAVRARVEAEGQLHRELEDFLRTAPRGTVAEHCKAERLEAELARTECMDRGGASGQDAPDTLACPKPFDYAGCLVLGGDRR